MLDKKTLLEHSIEWTHEKLMILPEIKLKLVAGELFTAAEVNSMSGRGNIIDAIIEALKATKSAENISKVTDLPNTNTSQDVTSAPTSSTAHSIQNAASAIADLEVSIQKMKEQLAQQEALKEKLNDDIQKKKTEEATKQIQLGADEILSVFESLGIKTLALNSTSGKSHIVLSTGTIEVRPGHIDYAKLEKEEDKKLLYRKLPKNQIGIHVIQINYGKNVNKKYGFDSWAQAARYFGLFQTGKSINYRSVFERKKYEGILKAYVVEGILNIKDVPSDIEIIKNAVTDNYSDNNNSNPPILLHK